MKKIMVGILIIIPILIVSVVAAVTTFVSVNAYIAVEKVKLSKKSIEIQFTTEEIDLNNLLSVEITPEKATNKTVEWTIESLTCLDEVYAENLANGYVDEPPAYVVDDKGIIKLNTYCSFYVKASVDNLSDMCFVYIVDKDVKKVTIKSETNLTVGDVVRAEAVYTPVESVVENATWLSSNESVLKVDGNGVISAIGAGTATISHFVTTDDGQVSASISIGVVDGVTKYGKDFYSHKREISLEDLRVDENDITALENCTISDGKIIISDYGVNASFEVNGEKVNVYACAEKDIEIENAKIYDFDLNDEFAITVGSKLYLGAKYSSVFSLGTPSVIWSSDDERVATIDENGVVSAIGRGNTAITATSSDGVASITLRVENQIAVLAIDCTTESFEVGIARETVFASARYANAILGDYTTTNNFFAINFLRPTAPEDINEAADFYSAFNFEVYENGEPTDKAYFVGNVLYFNKDKITDESKQTLKVVVSAKYPRYRYADYTTCSFEVNVVSGVAANSWKDLKRASDEHRAISFESDVKFMDDPNGTYDNWRDIGIFAYKNIYGNGKSYSAEFQQVGDNDELILIVSSNVTISNLIVRCNTAQDEIASADETKGMTGRGINVYQLNKDNVTHHENITIEYCIVENCMTAIIIDNADVTINGSVIRNCSVTGIYSGTSADERGVFYTNLTLRNCIMSNLVGTGVNIYYGGYSNGKNAYNTPEMAEKNIAEGKNSTLTQEGFLDIYNWQPIDVLNLLSDYDNALFTMLNTIAREKLLSNKDFVDTWSVSYNRTNYFHLGFISSAIGEESKLVYTLEDERIQMVRASDVLGPLPVALDAMLFSYGQTYGDITPQSTYTLNNKTINRLHGN